MKKNSLISFLQAWGILLVVLGHCDFGAPQRPLWCVWLYSFHMPLFMFISGYLLRYGCEKRGLTFVQSVCNRGFLWKKAKRLLVPYVIISTLAFVPKVLLSQFATRPIAFSFKEYIHMLVYPWDNVIIFFWFLPTLFLIFSILHIFGGGLQRCRLPLWGFLLISLILHLFNPFTEIQFLNIAGVIKYFFYFLLGYFVRRKDLSCDIVRHPVPFLLFTFLLSVVLLLLPDFRGLDVLCAVNGIALSFALGTLYLRTGCRWLHPMFGASYTIYLYSWFPQVVSQQVFLSLTGAPWWVGGLLAFIMGLLIPLGIHRWITGHRESRLGKIAAFVSGM